MMSPETRALCAEIETADEAIKQGDFAAAIRIEMHLAAGTQMERFGSEIVWTAIANGMKAMDATCGG